MHSWPHGSGYTPFGATLKLAIAIWLIGPLPLILTDAAFMKLHRVFVVSYVTGWLAKLAIIAVAMASFCLIAASRYPRPIPVMKSCHD